MALFPLYRWLCRSDCVWLDTVTEVETVEPHTIVRVWPGTSWEHPRPLTVFGESIARCAVSELYHQRDEKPLWRGEGVHHFYIHPDAYFGSRLIYSMETRLGPVSMWRALQFVMQDRLWDHCPENHARQTMGNIPEETDNDLKGAAAERRARATVRTLLGDKLYRRYLRDGFVSVRAKSGRTYTIPGGLSHAGVFEKGVVVDSVCLQLPSDYCDSDQFLFRYIKILTDEADYLAKANHHPIPRKVRRRDAGYAICIRSLPDLAREVRAACEGPMKPVAEAIREVKAEQARLDAAIIQNGTRESLELQGFDPGTAQEIERIMC